jgi:lysozyme
LQGQFGGVGLKPNAYGQGAQAGGFDFGGLGGDPEIMKMIRDHEGTRYEPYKDSQGLWTVGVGHLIGDGKTLPTAWNRKFSEDEVNSMFAKDYDYHSKAAAGIPGFDKLNKKGQGALVDMTFNMGPAWANKFPRFIESLKSGNIFSMISELQSSAWFKQVGRRAMDDIALLKDGFSNMKLMADGGVTEGPSIAGEAGPEAVIPLPNGRSIPVDMDMSSLVDKMDEMIRVMKEHKSTSERILQASA